MGLEVCIRATRCSKCRRLMEPGEKRWSRELTDQGSYNRRFVHTEYRCLPCAKMEGLYVPSVLDPNFKKLLGELSENKKSMLTNLWKEYKSNNLKIQAIKFVRECLNCGLLEAKEFVSLWDTQDIGTLLLEDPKKELESPKRLLRFYKTLKD